MKVKLDNQVYTLQKQIGEGNFATVYQTQISNLVAKVTFKSNPKAFQAFQIELEVLTKVQGEGIVRLEKGGVTQLQGQQVGILILENCSKGSLIDIMCNVKQQRSEQMIMIVVRDITKALIQIHQAGYIHRDVKMENVLLNQQGQFKLCDFGSVTKIKYTQINNQNRDDIKEEVEQNTTPYYRAPEYIDFYSGYQLTEKADIFALGKPPFESGLAAVNNHYFLPENHNYSQKFISLIQKLFTVNPNERPSAQNTLDSIQTNWTLPQRYFEQNDNQTTYVPNLNKCFNSVDNVYLEKKETPLGFFDQLKRYIFTLSKKTEAWVVQSTCNDENPPRMEDIRLLVIKAWLKREKIVKFYEAVHQKVILGHINNKNVVLKLAILLHQYIKKGPPEAMKEQKQKTIPSIWTIIQTITDVYKSKLQVKQLRILPLYYQIIQFKLKICYDNKDLFEASYSLNPLFSRLEKGQLLQPIDSRLFDSLLQFWGECLNFSDILLTEILLWKIQTVIIVQMVDELYCLLSMFLHLWIAVKQTINLEQNKVDRSKLKSWISFVDESFSINFNETKKFFEKCSSLSDFADIKQYIPKLPLEIIEQINKIEYGKTSVEISPIQNICGIKIPLSYQVTIQRLQFQQELLSMSEFDKPQQQQQESASKDFFADFGFLQQQEQQQQQLQQSIQNDTWNAFNNQQNNELLQQSEHSDLPQFGRDSIQTEVDPKMLSQIMFQINYSKNEVASAKFNLFDNFSFAQSGHKEEKQQENIQSLIQELPQVQIVEEIDLLNQEQNNQQVQNVDLLTFDDGPEDIIIPEDINFNQQQPQNNQSEPQQNQKQQHIQFQQQMQIQPQEEQIDFIPMSYDTQIQDA